MARVKSKVWAVVTTHPHGERKAVENLARQGFEVYCPMIAKRRSHARRVENVLRPLFPGYAFVSLIPSHTLWRPILSTAGVRGLVRFGEEPATLEPEFVAQLKAREVDGAVVRPAEPLAVGQTVQLAGGPFDGLIAEILALDDKDRVVVLLDVMNRGVKARVESRWVTPVQS